MIGAAGPQVLPITESMTIIDALASSGDIGEKGKTNNILVIREKGVGEKEFKRLNLTNASIFYSPYFYVQPNDIVYVEPAKIKTKNAAQIISYITAGVSFALLIINQVLKL